VELEYRGAGDVKSDELSRALSLSRDSVHQLLLPLVRRGWVTAGRGRLGGYRVSPTARKATAYDVIAVYARHVDETPGHRDPFAWASRLEEQADVAYRHVFESVTVGELAAEVRARRDALAWSI
jgi:DNA-binding IscR family transcriptional regulator